MDKELQILEALVRVADTKNSIEEFVKAFGVVIDIFEKMKTNNESERAQIQLMMSSYEEKIQKRLLDLKNGKDGQDGKDSTLVGPQGLKGDDGESIIGEPGKDGKDGSPDMAEDIRNKLELLEGDDRLDISAIKGLDAYEKRITRLEKRPIASGWSSASGGKIMKYYDLSPLFDGITVTFALPAFWRVINVQLSSAPNPLRENVDFTIDSSAFKITFTSQVNPSTALSAGQSCIVLYAEA